MTRETIDIQLTPEERSLLLRYGYPFEQIEQALKACESIREIEIVPMDRFELGQLIGDVCRSINHMKSGATQNQLLDLCDRLEAAEAYGDGMLDTL
jgi:hydroxypyruvate isomerase